MDQQALFQAILDHPDEDDPRFVYADWLEENGDSDRGEFIRLEVKLHRNNKLRHIDPKDPASSRHHELKLQHRDRWLAQMPKLEGIRWWAFWRGFATVQVSDWPTLKKHAAKIWAASPCEEIDLGGLSQPGGRAFGRSPWLAKIRALSMNWIGRHRRPGFRALLQSPLLENLRVLNLKSTGLGDEGVKLLAACPHLTNLQELVAECNDITEEGALAMARTPYFPNLKRLYLTRNPIEGEAELALKRRWGRYCC
jgi:uncharacterized protein (TIGR02996 family)